MAVEASDSEDDEAPKISLQEMMDDLHLTDDDAMGDGMEDELQGAASGNQ